MPRQRRQRARTAGKTVRTRCCPAHTPWIRPAWGSHISSAMLPAGRGAGRAQGPGRRSRRERVGQATKRRVHSKAAQQGRRAARMRGAAATNRQVCGAKARGGVGPLQRAPAQELPIALLTRSDQPNLLQIGHRQAKGLVPILEVRLVVLRYSNAGQYISTAPAACPPPPLGPALRVRVRAFGRHPARLAGALSGGRLPARSPSRWWR